MVLSAHSQRHVTKIFWVTQGKLGCVEVACLGAAGIQPIPSSLQHVASTAFSVLILIDMSIRLVQCFPLIIHRDDHHDHHRHNFVVVVVAYVVAGVVFLLLVTTTNDTSNGSSSGRSGSCCCCCYGWIHDPIRSYYSYSSRPSSSSSYPSLRGHHNHLVYAHPKDDSNNSDSNYDESSTNSGYSSPYSWTKSNNNYQTVNRVAKSSSPSRPQQPTERSTTATTTPKSELQQQQQTQREEVYYQSSQYEYYRGLYPPTKKENIQCGTFQTDGVHTIYYEIHNRRHRPECRQEEGKKLLTALVLHGGPGSGCFANHARFFSPLYYDKIVLMDQRGCGRSTPRGSMVNQTLGHILEDCETLRELLHLEKWDVLLGGSWGTTVALAYAQLYPKSVRTMVLRGICTFRQSEVDWLFRSPHNFNYSDSTAAATASTRINPTAWQEFQQFLSQHVEQEDEENTYKNNDTNENGRRTLHGYYDCLLSQDNPELKLEAAKSWMKYEFAITSSSSSSSSDNNTKMTTLASQIPTKVLVSPGEQSPPFSSSLSSKSASASSEPARWKIETHTGEAIPYHSEQDIELVVSELRQGLKEYQEDKTRNGNLHNPLEIAVRTSPRPVGQVRFKQKVSALKEEQPPPTKGGATNATTPTTKNSTSSSSFTLPPNYIPSQQMLTCYYSTNRDYVMAGIDRKLWSHPYDNNSLLKSIIAIQGGKDTICPPDTALDLKARTPLMELRIPLEGGHSMYDPHILNELILATDRIGRQSVFF